MKNKKVYVVFIGTQKYAGFFELWYTGVQNYLFADCEKTILAFSDLDQHKAFYKPGVIKFKIPHLPWPYVTLARFEFIKSALEALGDSSDATHLLFLDADLIPVKDSSFEDIFGDDSKKFVSVHHPGNAENPRWNSFVISGDSTSKIENPPADLLYRQGCLWGGQIEAVKEMIEECVKNIAIDTSNGVMADWHDESHMNCWFAKNNEEVRTLTPDYAWPNQPHWDKTLKAMGFSGGPVMSHLDKPMSVFPRFKGNSGNLPVKQHIIKTDNE